jgi:hypothetical protein
MLVILVVFCGVYMALDGGFLNNGNHRFQGLDEFDGGD